jgi:SAM-dependent methyltransferase
MNRYLAYLKQKSKEFFNKPFLIAVYLREYFLFKNLLEKENRGFYLGIKNLYPCLTDNTEKMSPDLHYVYHPAWAARIIAKIKPEFHIDISSILYFSAIVSAFVPVKYYEFRKVYMNLDNLTTGQANLLMLPFPDNSVKSISCMHTIEHIGLGRYGDPIDVNGDLKSIKELKRVLAKGGSLLFVVPIGKPRIYFNAHRVYSYNQIMNYFSGLNLKEFTLIPKGGEMIYNASKELADKEDYGCGCFWFVK